MIATGRMMLVVRVVLCGGVALAEEPRSALGSLRSGYKAKKAEITQSVDRLNSSYASKLGKMQAAAMKSGHLESVILIRTEREGLAKGAHVEAPVGDLREQQRIYFSELARLKKAEIAAMRELQMKYLAALESLRGRLTKARRFDEALVVQNEWKPLKAEFEAFEKKIAEAAANVGNLVAIKPVSVSGEESFKIRYRTSTPVIVDGTEYPEKERIFAHAPSTLKYEFRDPVTSFESLVAVVFKGSDSSSSRPGSVMFKVLAGNKLLHESGVLKNGAYEKIDIRFEPTRELSLVTDPGENASCDHAFWVKPKAL